LAVHVQWIVWTVRNQYQEFPAERFERLQGTLEAFACPPNASAFSFLISDSTASKPCFFMSDKFAEAPGRNSFCH